MGLPLNGCGFECLDAVAEVYRLCADTDTATDVEVVWRPRTEDWQKHGGHDQQM